MRKVKTSQTDKQNSEWTTKDFANATHVQGKDLAKALRALRKGRGPQVSPKKVAIAIRLNPKIVSHFKAGGKGWQGRMEEVLGKATKVKAEA
jgi:uncharacterized protein (DUF4415 family)